MLEEGSLSQADFWDVVRTGPLLMPPCLFVPNKAHFVFFFTRYFFFSLLFIFLLLLLLLFFSLLLCSFALLFFLAVVVSFFSFVDYSQMQSPENTREG